MFDRQQLHDTIDILENLRDQVNIFYNITSTGTSLNNFERPTLGIYLSGNGDETVLREFDCGSSLKHDVMQYLKDKF